MIFARSRTLISAIWRTLQSPHLLFYTLLYFMVLLVAGTVAQKYIGLFSSTHLFFNSFVYWYGILPLPAGASILTLLFVNLGAHFISKSQWTRAQIGTTLAHLSVLVLLFGGAMTLATKHEGFMILRPNTVAKDIYDYHAREFVVFENGKVILKTDPDSFEQKNFGGFTVNTTKLCKNCIVNDKKRLVDLPPRLEDELNQWGIQITIGSTPVILSEFQGNRFDTQIDGKKYGFVLRRKRLTLPFSLMLQNFTQEYYQGTDIAKHYESSLLVSENGQQWPTLVSMNNPFRYRGYTFYQSSLLSLPGQQTASVLNVVKNDGWLFPYIATALLCIGLILHLGARRHGPK